MLDINTPLTGDKSTNFQWRDSRSADEMQFIDSGFPQWRLTVRSPLWRPPTDILETEDAILVKVEIAGMRDEDFNIQLDGRQLVIRGIRSDFYPRHTPGGRAYHQMEIRFGEFSIEMELPVLINGTAVQAEYENGFLLVTLPKTLPVHIQIEDEDL